MTSKDRAAKAMSKWWNKLPHDLKVKFIDLIDEQRDADLVGCIADEITKAMQEAEELARKDRWFI